MTSTEIATYQPANVAASIEATARALTDAHTIGSALCRTAFVPKHFQGKPDDAAAAILYGATIDMDPVTALQNIFVIGGKPALYARTMVAIAMSQGHEIWTEEESEGSVTVCGRRKGSDKVERVTWTTEMAKRAGYTSNAKYNTDPRSMLYARASGDVARRIAPDALLGMAHNVEELSLERPVSNDRPAGGLGAALAAQHAPAEPETPAAATESTSETPAGDAPITDRTRKALFALMGEVGIGDDDDQRAFLTDTLGRDVESRSTLTEAEGIAAGQRLRRIQQGDADAEWTPEFELVEEDGQ